MKKMLVCVLALVMVLAMATTASAIHYNGACSNYFTTDGSMSMETGQYDTIAHDNETCTDTAGRVHYYFGWKGVRNNAVYTGMMTMGSGDHKTCKTNNVAGAYKIQIHNTRATGIKIRAIGDFFLA